MGNLEGFPFPFPLPYLPGFVFRPTEQELVCYYLRNKSSTPLPSSSSSASTQSTTSSLLNFLIRDVTNLCDFDPRDFPKKLGFHGGGDDDGRHCYFFTTKEVGYSENLQTKGGVWKIIERDQAVVSRSEGMVVGLRNTKVFFEGLEGQMTDWIMYEYTLVSDCHSASKGSFVLCHVFDGGNKLIDHFRSCDYEDDIAEVPDQRNYHGTSFSGIVEVDMHEETMVAPDDDRDELHKILTEIIGEPDDVAVDAFPFPMDISMANQLVNSDDYPEGLEGDFIELDDLLSPLTDTG